MMRFSSALMFAALVGCHQGPDLRVDLVTDLVPGFEFQVLEVDLYENRPVLSEALSEVAGLDGGAEPIERIRVAYFDYTPELAEGVNLGEFTRLKNGRWWILARFYSPDMDIVGQQVVEVEVRGDTAVTILFTRDCAGVTCPMSDDAENIACLRGQCVDPRCPQDPAFCPPPECTRDVECDAFDGFEVAECARMLCRESYCFAGAVEGGCPDGMFCHPNLGCRVLGAMDAGMDAGSECRSVACAPPGDCRVGGVNCETESCDVIGFSFPGAMCSAGECDNGGNCLGPSLTVMVPPEGGQIVSEPAGIACGVVCEARFVQGSTIVLTALPDEGFHFVMWNGACGGETEPSCVLTSDRSLPTIGAVFERDEFTLDVTTDGDGEGVVTGASIDCGFDCDALVTFGQMVTLTATPDAGTSFAGWGGACTGTATPTGAGECTFTATQAAVVNATFVLGTDFLAVTRSGTGAGTVTSAPAGINCGTSCAEGYTSGTVVALSAVPSAGSSFVGWTGACSGMGACNVTVSGSQTVGAEFELGTFPLDIVKEGPGDGQIVSVPTGIDCGATCNGSFDFGQMVTLTAVPDALSDFVGWSGGGCAGAGACVVSITAATTVRAQFGRRAIRIDAERAGTGDGVVTSMPTGVSCAPDCDGLFDAGTMVTFAASPAVGSRVAGMGRDCMGMTCTDFTAGSVLTLDVMLPTRVTAFFELLQYDLMVAANGPGAGTITSDIGGINCGGTCSATYTHGQMVTLTAAQAAGSDFAGWGGACASAGASPTCVVDMMMARSATATFTLVSTMTGTLNVARLGSGSGTVTSVPAGIQCGALCAATFDLATMVTLTAAPAFGSTFGGWSGACTGMGTCDVTIAAIHTVNATFDPQTYTVTINKTGTGAGLVSTVGGELDCGPTCSVVVDHGTALTVTASATAGSDFDGWAGGTCSGTGPCAITITNDVTLGAPFTLRRHTLRVSPTGVGGGTITSVPSGISCGADCMELYDFGTMVTLTPVADVGSGFIGWSGACTGAGTCVVSMSGDQSVVAQFDAELHPATVTPAGTGVGTVTSSPPGIDCGVDCSEDYLFDTDVTLTAMPDVSSTFTGWSGAGCSGTGSCVIDMTAARNVTATHDIRRLDLTVSTAGPGTIIGTGINCGGDCSETFDYGSNVTLTAAAMGVGTFAGWGGACAAEVTNVCTVRMTAALGVSANFATGNTLTVTRVGSGTVTSAPAGINCGGDCTEDYAIGEMVTLTAGAAANYDFTGWSGSGCGGTGICVVTMSMARSVTATFSIQQRSLTVTNNTTGRGATITALGINCGGDCLEGYDHGTVTTVSASVNIGAVFSGWSGAGCSGTADCDITMTADRVVTGTFVPEQHTLDVSTVGGGAGTIGSDDALIACTESGGDCGETYDYATSVTLTAAAGVGADFTGWSGGGCSGTGACVVSMTQARSVTATFDPQIFNVSIGLLGTGTGVIRVDNPSIDCPASECAGAAPYGTVATIMATETGDTFDGWGGDCAPFGMDPFCMVTITADINLSAQFTAPASMFRLELVPPGVGIVEVTIAGIRQPDCTNVCMYTYTPGDVFEMLANPPPPVFGMWQGGGLCGGSVNPMCVDMPPPDQAFAVF